MYTFVHVVKLHFYVYLCSCFQTTCLHLLSLGVTCGAGLLTLPEHLSSPTIVSGVRSLVFCVMFWRSFFEFFSYVLYCLSFCLCFLLAIVFYVLLLFTASD